MYHYRFIIAIAMFVSINASAQSLPEGEGKDIVENTCNQCHELGIVTATPRTAAQWQYVVTMMLSLGAPLEEGQVETVVGYLSKNFGKPAQAGPDTGQGETAD
jgi:hypothetical protein